MCQWKKQREKRFTAVKRASRY